MATTLTSNLFNLARQACTATAVPSFSRADVKHTVRDVFTPFASCTCEDFQFRRQREIGDGRVCKHIEWARQGITKMVALVRELRDQVEDPVAA